MLTKKVALSQLNQFLLDLKAFGIHPTKAVLFGSVAKGRQKEWSDIDVAIWAPEFSGVLGLDIELILPVLRPYDRMEIHTFHPTETPETNPFVGEIVRTGIEVEV